MKLIENEKKNNIHQLLLNTFTGGVMLQEIKSVKTVPLKTTHAFCVHMHHRPIHIPKHITFGTLLYSLLLYTSRPISLN